MTNTIPNQESNSTDLVNITVRGKLLPSLFDSVKTCKGRTVMSFQPHHVTLIGAEYSGEECEENLSLGMSFVLTKHSCEAYSVSDTVRRQIKIDDVIRVTNTKIFKNKAASKNATINIAIRRDTPSRIHFCICESNGNTITQSIPCEEANKMPFEYDDTFDLASSRVIDATVLHNALNVLANNAHQLCTIELDAKQLKFTGDGDGKKFANANDCCIVMGVLENDKVEALSAKASFRVADLQRFAKSNLENAYIYLETDKPLLIEYMLDTSPVSDDQTFCDDCLTLDMVNANQKANAIVRYIVAEEEDDENA